MSANPKILDVLGSWRSVKTISDDNLKTLHAYLFIALIASSEELKRRGLSDGEEVYLRIAKPE